MKNYKNFKSLKAKPPKEDILHKQIGGWLTLNENNLKSKGLTYYTYSPAGEKRQAITGALLKKKGVRKGDPDYRLEFKKDNRQYSLYIECKRDEKGRLTEEQQKFFDNHEGLDNVKCHKTWTLEQFIKAVNEFIINLK